MRTLPAVRCPGLWSGRACESECLLLSAQGDFIIAHCGGFHSFFNTLIKAVNLVAKLLGHRIRW